VGLLVLLRIAQYLSIATLVYDDELTEMARLALDLSTGDFVLDSPLFFAQKYTFQPFSQGTLLLQIVTAGFALVLGPTSWALQSAVLLFETIAFAGLLALGARIGGRRGLGLAALLWLVATPASVIAIQLMPYGIHSEFLFIPLAGIAFAAHRPPNTWKIQHWVAASLWMALGIVLFRSNLFPALAFTAAVVLVHRGRSAALALAALIGAGLFGGLCLQWLSVGGWGAMPQHVSPGNWTPLEAIGRLPAMLGSVFPAPRLGAPLDLAWRVLLLLGMPLALFRGLRRPTNRSLILIFASLWTAMSLAAVALLGELQLRYLCPPFYALLLCWLMLALDHGVSARVRKATSAALVLLALGGASDGVQLIHPSVWAQTLSFEAVRIGQELKVRYVELDELPYLQKILDEGRGSPWIGGRGDLLGRCSNLPLSDSRVTKIRHPAKLDCLLSESEDPLIVLREARNWTNDDVPLEVRLTDMGRGAWIRSGRDLLAMEQRLSGVDQTERDLLLAGARDEARRWGELPPTSGD
jgi:hypothetical protein